MQIFVNKNLQYVKVIALAAPLTCLLCDFAFVVWYGGGAVPPTASTPWQVRCSVVSSKWKLPKQEY